MKPSIATVTVALVLLGAAFASAKGGALVDAFGGSSAPQPRSASNATVRVAVGGHVVGLYPGAARKMRTTVRNGYDHPVRLRSIKVKVGPGASGCAARNLRVGQIRHGRRVVPRRHSATVGLRVRMSAQRARRLPGRPVPASLPGASDRGQEGSDLS